MTGKQVLGTPSHVGGGYQVPQLDKSKGCVAVLGMLGAEAEQGTVLLCLAVCQVPQLDKSKYCVAVLAMLLAEAEQVAGTVLLCLTVLWCLTPGVAFHCGLL